MPIYEIQTPDGASYQVDAPEGADPEKIVAEIMGGPKSTLGNGQGLLRQFAHGASFGFDDELAGAVSALTGGDYKSARDAYRKESEGYAAANPKKALAANLVGGVMMGAGAGGALGKTAQGAKALTALKTLPKWGQLSTIGGATGAVAGAGEAPEISDIPASMASGAVTGALTGAVLPPLVSGAVKLGNSVIGAPVRAVVNAMRSPEQQGVRLTAKYLARDQLTPEQLAANLKMLGPNATLADAGGKNILALGDFAAQAPGTAKDAGMRLLEERAQGAGPRVISSLTKGLGVNSTNIDDAVQQLHANMRGISPQYETAMANAEVPMTEKLGILIKDPIVKRALSAAKGIVQTDSTLSQLEGKGALDAIEKQLSSIEATQNKTARAFGSDVPLIGTGKVSLGYESAPTLRAWDYVKRGLDSIIDENTDAITGKMTNLGRQASQLKYNLVNELDTSGEGGKLYQAARSAYADEKASEYALKLGRAFLNEDSEVTARHFSAMSAPEKQFFKMGAARAVRDKILGAPDTGMAYAKFDKTPILKERLKAAFGNDSEFNAFMQNLKNEVRMGQTFERFRGNSATASRSLVAKDVGEPITGSDIPTSWRDVVKRAGLAITKPSDEVAGQLADILYSNNPDKNAATIARLQGLNKSLLKPVLSNPNINPLAVGLLGQQVGPIPYGLLNQR